MKDHLPERLDLLACAEAGRTLQGHIELARLERVLPLLNSADGELQVQLELGKDTEGTRYLEGHISGAVELQCQRCLESISLPLELSFRLGIVTSHEAATRLHARYEPLVAGSEPALVADIVSDEVMLAMPLVPVHADAGACGDLLQDYRVPVQRQRENPFAALAKMKRKN
jgi:uncharacterized protein